MSDYDQLEALLKCALLYISKQLTFTNVALSFHTCFVLLFSQNLHFVDMVARTYRNEMCLIEECMM